MVFDEPLGGLIVDVAAQGAQVSKSVSKYFSDLLAHPNPNAPVEGAQEEAHLHRSAAHVDDGVSKEDGVAVDVRAAQVEEPADLIERIEHLR